METEIEKSVVDVKDLWKIREMYLSDSDEDISIAYNWLCQLIGDNDANVNLFILTFYKDYESDKGERIDDKNYWDIQFKTYPTYFGKDYRYKVQMVARFGGILIMNEQMDYSRYNVGNGQPKYDMIDRLCEIFKKAGYKFYNGLFTNNQKQ